MSHVTASETPASDGGPAAAAGPGGPIGLHQPTARDLQPALNAVVQRTLAPLSLALGGLFLFFTVTDLLPVPGSAGTEVALLDAIAAGVFLAVGGALYRWPVPPSWAHAVAAGIAGVVIAFGVAVLVVVPSPVETMTFVMLALGAGVVFLDVRWLAGVMAATLAAWGGVVAASPASPEWMQFGQILVTAVVLGMLVHQVRVTALRRVERHRFRDHVMKARLRDANRRLSTSQERLRRLSDAAFEGIAVHRNGRVVDANGAFGDMFGVPAAEVGDVEIAHFVVPDHRARLERALAEPAGESIEVLGMRRDGSTFPMELSARRVEDDASATGVVATRDVTDRRRAEEERLRNVARAQELERLRELDEFKTHFINTAAHELATPLTPIKLHLHMMRAGDEDVPVRIVRSLDVFERNVDRLHELVTDILESARIQASRLGLDRRPTDINRIVMETVDSFNDDAHAAGIELSSRLGPDVVAEADARRLVQVLVNLLGNAIKFSPDGGEVTVETKRQNDTVLVQVRDQGMGLTNQQAGELFKPFSQVHDTMQTTEPSTGLGLYICRGIVELHGGRIWVSSDGPGRGSTFSFTIPIEAPTPVAPMDRASASATAAEPVDVSEDADAAQA